MRRNLLIVGLGLVSFLRPPRAVGQDIHEAVSQGDVAAVRALLSSDPLQARARDQQGRTPLHVVATLGNLDLLSIILAAGAEIDAIAGDGSTALQLAVLGGRSGFVESLLEHGADANLRSGHTGFSAVDLAFQEECWQRSRLTRVLLAGGGKLDVSRPMGRRMNALDLAVEFGNPDMVRLVVEAGADVNATLYPAVPLSMAALNGYSEIVKILVSAGADVNTADPRGGVPIRWAVERGHIETARVLLANGADVGYTDAAHGRNLLHLATLAGQPDLVALLLEYGLSPNATDRSGRTALDYATRYGHKAVADLLLPHDAVHGEAPVERFGISPELTREMGDGEAVAWYLNHRGCAVRTRNHILVFDAEEFGVTRPHEPSLANGFITAAELATHPVIALFTNYHGETGELAYVHHLQDSLHAISYVHNGDERWRGTSRTTYLLPGADTVVDGVRIRAVEVKRDFPSLGYLIHVDGLQIYYASFRVENREGFAKALEALAENTDRVDLAFLPIVEPDETDSEFNDVLSRLNPRAVLLLDPGRRESLFPRVAERVRAWGFTSPVFAAENPGDAFIFRRP